MVAICSWGRLALAEQEVCYLTNCNEAAQIITSAAKPGLAYGMGRSYGDVCLNPGGILWNTTGLNHFIHFDEITGHLICEAGVLLRDIQQTMIPKGWMLPVTPGTQWVTVGGAIANDIHGKNHHMFGSFGNQLHKIKLLRTDGKIIECGPNENPEWFAATVGGLGLTGIILTAELQLRPVQSPWLEIETIPYTNLEKFFNLADESVMTWEYTVAWLDINRSRGLFIRGQPIDREQQVFVKRQLSIPINLPVSLINKLTLLLLNKAYFFLQKRRVGRTIMHYEPFFYPLDNLLHWNRLYGPNGFYQYQCVITRETLSLLLKEINKAGERSFLTVLKTFGEKKSVGMLSFPKEGVTLAVDFPNKGSRTLALLDRLDAIVQETGGRIYPAKDACMSPELFASGYPRLNEFLSYRDPGVSSAFSRRLLGQ